MIPRILEPEVMDTPEEARDYDAMDHSEVNRLFVADLLEAMEDAGLEGSEQVLDLGTGTAQIPIEMCRQTESPQKIIAVDLASEMLKVAEENVHQTDLEQQIKLVLIDAKQLPYDDEFFDVVMSNSIVHHIPEPLSVLAESFRVLSPGGLLFVRDLLRPDSQEQLDQLVEQYAGGESDHARKMFAESLHAALTVEELQELCAQIGMSDFEVTQTSDRHWTLNAFKTV